MNETQTLPVPPTYAVQGPFAGWNRFWFLPVSPLGLHIVRFLTGLLILGWLLGFGGAYQDLLGTHGWFDEVAYDAATRLGPDSNIPMNWGHALVPSSPALLGSFYLGSIVVTILFTLGIATRIAAPLLWLVVVAFTSNPVLYYGGDAFLIVLMLYLSLGYILLDLNPSLGVGALILGSPTAPLWRWRSSYETLLARPSVAANLALRLIQVHVAIIVFMSCLHKFQDPEWWAGDSLWYSIYTPFGTDMNDLVGKAGQMDGMLIMLSLGAYLTMAWQLTFPIQPLSHVGRIIMVVGALIGGFWCAFIAGQPIYGPALLIGALASLPPGTWTKWFFRKGRPATETRDHRISAAQFTPSMQGK